MNLHQNVKIASPMASVINTLNKAKKKFQKVNINIEVIKVDYQDLTIYDLLLDEKIDGLIYTNIHVFNAVNNFLKTNNKELLEFVQPFYHSKYGLYINQKRQPVLKDLEAVKQQKGLKVLLATAFVYIEPCDIPRSLILLNNLGLIKIPQATLQKKKFGLTLSDIQNTYQLELIKSSQIPEKFLNNPQKYDLMANWPAFMNPYKDFKRIAANIEGNQEPTDDFIMSYAIGLACKKSRKDSEKTKLIQTILNDPEVKEFHFQEGGPNQDYVMIKDPLTTGKRIKALWQKHY